MVFNKTPTQAPSVWDALARALSPVEFCPQIIPTLEVSHHTTRAGAAYLVLRNPTANTYLKLEPREYDLVLRMDGSCNLTALVLEDFRLHHVLAPPRVAGLIELLRQKRFLTEPPLDAYAELQTHLARPSAWRIGQRLARGFVQTELSLRNVDPPLARLYGAGGWLFFSRAAGLVAGLVTLLGLAAYVLGLFDQQAGRIAGANLSLWHVLGLTLGLLVIHELGHALAVKHARRHVPRAGILIYYGFPGAFVDTTDIWMAAPRYRLLTTLAGPLTGVVIGAVLALAAYVVPAVEARAWLFASSTLFWLHAALNLNPLLELDGYFVLVDVLEKPRLRARALAFISGPLWTKLWRRERLSREEWLFAAFGALAGVWSVIAIWLGMQFWTRHLGPLVQANWAAGGPLTRGLLVVLAGLLAIAGLIVAGGFLRELATRLAAGLAGRRQDAASRRQAEVLGVLQLVPLWASLPDDERARLARMVVSERVPAGAEIAREGGANRCYYLVAEGEFEVVADGQVVKTLQRGDDFGKRALLDDAPRQASVVATRAGRLLGLEREAFRAALIDDIERVVQLEAALSYQAELGHMPLFHSLTLAELRPLLERLEAVSVQAGTDIIRPGDPDDRLYIVRRGQAEIINEGRVIETLDTGEAFGGDELLDVPASAWVRVTQPTELLVLAYADLLAIVSQSADRAARH
jgi:putative peptide zinc metalloprotease protein